MISNQSQLNNSKNIFGETIEQCITLLFEMNPVNLKPLDTNEYSLYQKWAILLRTYEKDYQSNNTISII